MTNFAALLRLADASAATTVYTINLFNDNLESELALKLEHNMRAAIWMLGDVVRDHLLPEGVEQRKVEPVTDALEWPLVDALNNNIKVVREQYEPLSKFKGQAPFWPTISGTLTVLKRFEKSFEELEELLGWVMKMRETAEVTQQISDAVSN